jgi:adenosine deaminase
MSHITLTDEYLTAVETFGLTLDDLEKITINAMKSAFLPYDERLKYIYDILKPGFSKVRTAAKRKPARTR